MIERGKGVAIWMQIAARLRAEIEQAGIPPGGRLPSEVELAAQFGVNRHTIRRALEELSRTRLIYVEHGKGSFVAEPLMDYQISLRPRFSEWVRRHNLEPAGEKLGLRVLDHAGLPEADIARDIFTLLPGERILELERLGTADSRRIALSRHIFPVDRLPGLEAALLNCATITEALARIGIADYVRLRSRISCRMPTSREVTLLASEPQSPLLQSENVNVTADGTPLELCFAVYPSTRVALVVEPTS